MPDVLPSIIVLAITTLLVFRREVTIPRANKGAPRAAAARPSKAREASGEIAKADAITSGEHVGRLSPLSTLKTWAWRRARAGL
jgi:hypothetical protein